MASTSTFDVVNVESPPFEYGSCVLKKPSLVETVGMDMALDVLVLADTRLPLSVWSICKHDWQSYGPQTCVNSGWCAAKVFVKF